MEALIERDLVTLDSGMVRDTEAGKPDYTLIDLPLLERYARHMTTAAATKGRDNWRNASTDEDLQRFLRSAWRHFLAFQRNEIDEDHVAALCFNLAGAEYVRAKLADPSSS